MNLPVWSAPVWRFPWKLESFAHDINKHATNDSGVEEIANEPKSYCRARLVIAAARVRHDLSSLFFSEERWRRFQIVSLACISLTMHRHHPNEHMAYEAAIMSFLRCWRTVEVHKRVSFRVDRATQKEWWFAHTAGNLPDGRSEVTSPLNLLRRRQLNAPQLNGQYILRP